MPSLNSWYWRFLENHVYALPLPPPRKRTVPMEVICVGLPRSATESLQHALLKLGYDYTYHGWDIVFEEPAQTQRWVRLARRKFFGEDDNGDCTITAADFDEVLGHSMAVTDAAGSCFAPEMIRAYPNAKVILNKRSDLDKWHGSAVNNLVGVFQSNVFWIMSFLNKECFWAWHVYERLMWACTFRAPDARLDTGVTRLGKWVYREHCDMIRGLCAREGRPMLEWTVQDGWEPLCEFLGKEIPKEEFPRTNDAAGFKGREKQAMALWAKGAAINGLILCAVLGLFIALAVQMLK